MSNVTERRRGDGNLHKEKDGTIDQHETRPSSGFRLSELDFGDLFSISSQVLGK
jgi:hypothetical protein